MAELDDLKFSEDHEWVDLDDETASVGVTDHAQESLGDIVYVELPEVGASIAKNESVGSIESVKAVSDIFSPVTGEVVEVNEEATDNPEIINLEPYEKGWLFKVKISDPGELEGLMDWKSYLDFVS